MNSKNVIASIRKMNEAERIFASNVLTISKNLQSLENFFGKKVMAEKFLMTVRKWDVFKKGDNYHVRHIATMSAAIMEQEMEEARERNGIKFPEYKHREKSK